MIDDHGQPLVWKFNEKRRVDRSVDELLGLCKGIAADGKVVQAEAEFLQNWLLANVEIMNTWPANVLRRRIGDMLADGVLDANEQKELLEVLRELNGPEPWVEEFANMSTFLPIDDPLPKINFQDKVFCFTGRFLYGTRASCQETVQILGGAPANNITKKLDYLVVGAVGSRDWIHSSVGRKIEKAVDYRDQQATGLAIVSGTHWVEHVELATMR